VESHTGGEGARRAGSAQAYRFDRLGWVGVALLVVPDLEIGAVLASSPWVGEGYRKDWARLSQAGIRASGPGCCG
jgi:hypothetical protein